MAITFVGSFAGTHAATSAQAVNFSNLRDASNNQPTLQQGDLVLVGVENASTINRSTGGGADVLVPSGYTGIDSHDYRDDSNDSNFRVSHKFMGASPDSSVSIPASNATTAGVAYVISVWRGVDSSSPLDVAAVRTGAINTGVANGSAITPTTAGALILVFAGAAVAAGAVFTNPSGMSATTNHFRSATITTTTVDANVAVAAKTDWASGAFDPAAFGGSTSTNTGSWSAVTVALRPIPPPRTVTGSPSIDTFVSAAAAKALVEGVGSGTLNAFGSSASAGVRVKASASMTPGSFTASATATVSNPSIHATASPALASFTSTAAAKAIVKASAGPSLGSFISAAAAKALVEGVGTGVLNAFGSSSAGKVRVKASAAPALGSFTATAAARVPVEAQSSPVLGSFTLTARIASAAAQISGAPALNPFISQAAAQALIEGIGSGELNPFGLGATLSLPIRAQASPMLDAFTLTAVIASLGPIELTGNPMLEPFTSGSISPCPPSRWATQRRESRASSGRRRPSRNAAPNLQPRSAGR